MRQGFIHHARRRLTSLTRLQAGDRPQAPAWQQIQHALDSQEHDLLRTALALELLDTIEPAVARATHLRECVVAASCSEEADRYLDEATRCYFFGLFTACAVMCRSVLEEAIKQKLPAGLARLVRTRYRNAVTLGNLLHEINNNLQLTGIDPDFPRVANQVNDTGKRAVHHGLLSEEEARLCLQDAREALQRFCEPEAPPKTHHRPELIYAAIHLVFVNSCYSCPAANARFTIGLNMRMRPYRPAVLVALVCVLASGRLWAWGCTGHETVALIALKNLHDLDASNQTQIAQQVETLLSTQTHAYAGRFCKDLGLDPIAYFATWADDHRAVDPSTGNWHFWDIPLHVKSAALGEYCDRGCVVQALQDQVAILQDKSKDDAARSTALMYIIHFAGDMHQPLHEEDNNDRGGNCVPVTFLDTTPKAASSGSYSPNLHAIWDTQLVETIGKITRSGSDAKSQIEAFASRLETQHASDPQLVFHGSVDLVTWANEAHAIAIAAPYADLHPRIAPARKTAPVTACSGGGTSAKFLKKHETVSQAYITAVQGDIEGQLSRAGERLAAVLYATLK